MSKTKSLRVSARVSTSDKKKIASLARKSNPVRAHYGPNWRIDEEKSNCSMSINLEWEILDEPDRSTGDLVQPPPPRPRRSLRTVWMALAALVILIIVGGVGYFAWVYRDRLHDREHYRDQTALHRLWRL